MNMEWLYMYRFQAEAGHIVGYEPMIDVFLQCEPLYGWGFRRGGYICMCKPGYRYPPWQYGPFLGIEIDSATKEEYENGFDCIPVERTYGRFSTPVSKCKKSYTALSKLVSFVVHTLHMVLAVRFFWGTGPNM